MTVIVLLFCFPIQLSAQNSIGFEGTLKNGEEIQDMKGDASYINYPSLFSVFLKSENSSCGIHLMGLREKTSEETTFVVASKDSLNARVVCVFDNYEPTERFVADEGQIKIRYSERNKMLQGLLQVSLIGGVTDNKFEIEAEFDASAMD